MKHAYAHVLLLVSFAPVLWEGLIDKNNLKFTSSLLSDIPKWIISAAKMLNAGGEGEDWTALATVLGLLNNSLASNVETL